MTNEPSKESAAVFRWKLSPKHAITPVEMPKGSEVLNVAMTGPHSVSLFAVVDQDQAETEKRYFGIWATGKTIPSASERVAYITTLRGPGKNFHVFEVTAAAGQHYSNERIITKSDLQDIKAASQKIQTVAEKIVDKGGNPEIHPDLTQEEINAAVEAVSTIDNLAKKLKAPEDPEGTSDTVTEKDTEED